MDGDGGSVVLVEPFGAGGGPDLFASALAAQLTQIWAVSVTVDNRPGCATLVAVLLSAWRRMLLAAGAHYAQ